MLTEKKRRGRPVDQEARNFNIALYRLVKGECDDLGGVVAQLATITGLTENAIHQRVNEVHYGYKPEEIAPNADQLTSDDLAYLGRRYGKSNDPAIREFVAGVRTVARRKPDDDFSAKRRPSRN